MNCHFKCKLALLTTLIGSIGAALPNQAFSATSYHIGNSLTWDMAPGTFQGFATQRGLTHVAGYHVRGGSSLTDILSLPDDVSVPVVDSYGTFGNALPNYKWNAVTLQPHTGFDVTVAGEASSAMSLINLTRTNPANANTRFYIYSTWPEFGNYQAKWDAPIDESGHASERTRQYFEHVLNQVRAQTDASVHMIPVGDVFYELDKRLVAGAIPGYRSIAPFYRDSQHLSGLGRFTAALTAFATIRGEYPTGSDAYPADFARPNYPMVYGIDPPNAAYIYALINDVVQDVVGSHVYSGVQFLDPPRADFDDSGLVDASDLLLLQQSIGKSEVADADRDGDVDDADLVICQSQLGLTTRKASNFDPADVNQDGVTGVADLEKWRQSVGVNAGYDPDGDGDSDGQDVLRWQRSLTTTFAGDFNRDYVVNASDETVWAANNGFDIRADANGDGVVNQGDYAIWQEEEGRMWPPPPNYPDVAAVPEPASAILAPMALLAARFLANTRRSTPASKSSVNAMRSWRRRSRAQNR